MFKGSFLFPPAGSFGMAVARTGFTKRGWGPRFSHLKPQNLIGLFPPSLHSYVLTSLFLCLFSMPRQPLGQHFLADLDWREQIARAIRVSPHSTVPLAKDDSHCWIELGAGHGEMTRPLLPVGGPVCAIELDPRLSSALLRLAQESP